MEVASWQGRLSQMMGGMLDRFVAILREHRTFRMLSQLSLLSHLFFPLSISVEMSKMFHLLLQRIIVCRMLQPLLCCAAKWMVCSRWWCWLLSKDWSLLNWLFWQNYRLYGARWVGWLSGHFITLCLLLFCNIFDFCQILQPSCHCKEGGLNEVDGVALVSGRWADCASCTNFRSNGCSEHSAEQCAWCLTLSKLKLSMTNGLLGKTGKHTKTLSQCMHASLAGSHSEQEHLSSNWAVEQLSKYVQWYTLSFCRQVSST